MPETRAGGPTMALSSRWSVLALLCVVRSSVGVNFQTPSALAPFLIADMGITYAELGGLIGLFMFSGVFLALPGGLLGARFGDKAVVLAGLALLTVGAALLASTTVYPVAAAGRLASGAGGVLLTVQIPKIAPDWFAGRAPWPRSAASPPPRRGRRPSTPRLRTRASPWRSSSSSTGIRHARRPIRALLGLHSGRSRTASSRWSSAPR